MFKCEIYVYRNYRKNVCEDPSTHASLLFAALESCCLAICFAYNKPQICLALRGRQDFLHILFFNITKRYSPSY
jgi:hypothetical protein